jgi:transformation/transcription domain-associated protein
MKVLIEDNEENALVAQRIIFDLHKAFKPGLETQVQVNQQ